MDSSEIVKTAQVAAAQVGVDDMRDIAFVKILDHLIRTEESEWAIAKSVKHGTIPGERSPSMSN